MANKKIENEKENIVFEDAIKELEKTVRDLESGNVLLDEAIDKFTSAMKLAEICNEKLKNAEESINKILNKNGELDDFKIEE